MDITKDLVADLPGLYVVVDPQGSIRAAFGRSWKDLQCDRNLCVGRELTSIKGIPFRFRHVEQCLSTHEMTSGMSMISGRQYDCRYYEINGVGEEGKFVMCVATDVTQDLKAQQKFLEDSFEIQAMARTRHLEEITTAFAHEVNNPLTILLGNAMRIQMMTDGREIKSEVVLKIIQAVIDQGNRIAKIVTSFKEISRDGTDDKLADIQIEELLNIATRRVSKQFNTDGIKIRKINTNPEQFVRVRESQIVQAFELVILNAVQAIETMQEKWIDLEIIESANAVSIVVTDSGHGIPKHFQSEIMKPFFTTKPLGKALGIGLNIARRNVEALGGELKYDPAHPNTRFIISIPRSMAKLNSVVA